MGIASFLCIGIGIFPQPLYALLPYPVDFHPYTAAHVITQLQLLLFSALAFTWLMWNGVYPPELRSTNIDFDIVYRKFLPRLIGSISEKIVLFSDKLTKILGVIIYQSMEKLYHYYGPKGILAKSITAGSMVFWVLTMLGTYLVISLMR